MVAVWQGVALRRGQLIHVHPDGEAFAAARHDQKLAAGAGDGGWLEVSFETPWGEVHGWVKSGQP